MNPTPDDYLNVNRALWNARVPAHVGSRFYHVAGFLGEPCCLTGIEREMLGEV
jgi:hypothetical protein